MLPGPLGGDPALDFCNTRVGWAGGLASDYLESYDHLAVWAGEAGLLRPEDVQRLRRQARADRSAADAALQRAQRTRTSLYGGLIDPTDGTAFAGCLAAAKRPSAKPIRMKWA